MAKMLSSSKNSGPQQQQQQHFLQITQHDKFYSRLLSKESSLANPSFRIYYGGAASAVPFLWESQPGMPKKTVTATTLPPLTPPPSYNSTPKEKKKKAAKNPTRRSNLIQCILPRVRRIPNTSTSGLSSQFVSLSSSSTSSSGSTGSHRRRYSSPRSSFSSPRADDEDSVDGGSPTSTLGGCYSMLVVKNALLQFVGGGHGST